MSILNFRKKPIVVNPDNSDKALLAETALNHITDGVIIVDGVGKIKLINPAAVTMLGYPDASSLLGFDCTLVIHLQNNEGRQVAENENPLLHAIKTNSPFNSRDYVLITAQSERQMAISLTLTPTGIPQADKIITFRNITKELEEEGAQMEFISTASHEMRTPVASIEGYLSLALNPQTATIDARAQQYLVAAHKASQHLGHLFRDLLDVTKLDDGKLKPRLVPVEISQFLKSIADAHLPAFRTKNLKYSFGTPDNALDDGHKLEQLLYGFVDIDFFREIIDNLLENAIKYTPNGGAVWVNARGDGDRILINVTDSGIGIASDDLTHIFQKFYRVDNSQTQTIGGTGLGLYLVKTRVESMEGKVWAESAFGDGSTFYISLPRLSAEEYEKRRLVYENEQRKRAFIQNTVQAPRKPIASQPATAPTTVQPQQPAAAPMPMTAQPQQPVVASQPMSTPIINQPQGGGAQ